MKAIVSLAWTNVGLYLLAGLLFANNYGWERALRIYTGFDLVSKGWYEDALIRPGMFWISLVTALLVTRQLRRNR